MREWIGWQKIYIPEIEIPHTRNVFSTDRLVYLGYCWKQSTIQVSYPHAFQVYKLSIHWFETLYYLSVSFFILKVVI